MAVDITKPSFQYYTYDIKTKSDYFNVAWTFMKFSELEIDKRYSISSINPMPNCRLELIFIKGSSNLILSVANKLDVIIKFDLAVSIFDKNNKILFYEEKKEMNLKTEKTDLLSSLSSSIYEEFNSLPNDTLNFDLEFRVEKVLAYENFEELALNDYKYENQTILLNDLKTFVFQKLPTNIVLKMKDAQIEANKAILCARSSVFQKMFENPMSEQENDRVLIDCVVIDDLMGATVEILVNFMCTGDADIEDIEFPGLMELYYAADKYDVQNLRKMCVRSMLLRLTEENVCGVLKLAWKHSDEHLMKGCIIFMRRHIVSVLETDGWKDLKSSHPDIGFHIFEFYVKGVAYTD